MKWKIAFFVLVPLLAFTDIYSKHVVFNHFAVEIQLPGDPPPKEGVELYQGGRVFVPRSYQPIEVIPDFFYLAIVLNHGAVWGIMQNETLILTSVSVIAIFFILFLVLFKNMQMLCIPLGLISAGAVGNLWDRIHFAGVRDFLDFYIGSYHWPTFNPADCYIVIGVFSYLIIERLQSKKTAS